MLVGRKNVLGTLELTPGANMTMKWIEFPLRNQVNRENIPLMFGLTLNETFACSANYKRFDRITQFTVGGFFPSFYSLDRIHVHSERENYLCRKFFFCFCSLYNFPLRMFEVKSTKKGKAKEHEKSQSLLHRAPSRFASFCFESMFHISTLLEYSVAHRATLHFITAPWARLDTRVGNLVELLGK